VKVDFPKERYEKILEDSRRWWAHELKRPLIQARIRSREADGDEPDPGLKIHEMMHDFNVEPERIIRKLDYGLAQLTYLGDAFPYTGFNEGPGVTAAWMNEGIKCEVREDTIWFHLEEEQPIEDIHLSYNGEHPLYRRLCDVHRVANEYWDGCVQVSMTDLGGNLDLLVPFRPGERLLFDLYDNPDEVKRLTWQAHEAWWRYFNELNQIMHPPAPGYLSWLPLLCHGPTYVLQCDFCYMISPDMFDEFVKPELTASAERLTHCIYHLDGVGALPHLDSLLSIDAIDAIQWVYGDGQPGVLHWLDVYKRIRDAGKLLYLHASPAEFERVVEHVGSAKDIFLRIDDWVWQGPRNEVDELMEKYGAA